MINYLSEQYQQTDREKFLFEIIIEIHRDNVTLREEVRRLKAEVGGLSKSHTID